MPIRANPRNSSRMVGKPEVIRAAPATGCLKWRKIAITLIDPSLLALADQLVQSQCKGNYR